LLPASASPDRRAPLLLLAVSGGLLLGALGFQFVGGLAPCEMCHWQRWAHLAVIALALPAAILSRRPLALLAVLAMAAAAGLGLFHAGVEQGWWEGPTACASSAALAASPAEMLDNLLATPMVRCDAIPWSLFGLSMAGWNTLISAAAVAGAAVLLGRRS
jgi:disulfide bond formation protein DsbB